jgi:AraC-like DNA-binding protein
MHEFLEMFHPRIIHVFHRDEAFWEMQKSRVTSKPTRLLSFVYVYKGEGRMELDGICYPVVTGSIFQIPFGRHLILHNGTAHQLCYYTVQYDFTLVENSEDGKARCTEPIDKVLPLPLVVPMLDPDGVKVSMEKLYRLWNGRQSGFAAKTKLAFLALLHYVNDQLSAQRQESEVEKAIRASAMYIEQYYNNRIDRDMLARQVSLTSSYYSVLFKRYMGCTPVQYITRVRMDKAMQLLKETNLQISEVARLVGFEDALYFTRVFSHSLGLTPRAYRKA